MDKPASMSVKDYLVRIMALRTNTPSNLIEIIVNHQFEEANKALLSNNTVELSGFGKFLFNTKKAYKKLDKMMSKKEAFERFANDPDNQHPKAKTAKNKLINTIRDLEILKTKLYGNQQNNRGMEEPSDSQGGA